MCVFVGITNPFHSTLPTFLLAQTSDHRLRFPTCSFGSFPKFMRCSCLHGLLHQLSRPWSGVFQNHKVAYGAAGHSEKYIFDGLLVASHIWSFDLPPCPNIRFLTVRLVERDGAFWSVWIAFVLRLRRHMRVFLP